VTVNVPAVVAVYYTQSTYSGAFNLTVKTVSGSGVTLSPGDRAILYCDGVNVVSAQTASAPASNISGGAAGQVVYQTGVGATGFSATGTAGQVFISGGVVAPGWSDLGLITDSYSSKATPVDADELPLADSAATFGPKKLTWSNLKATLKTYFDTLYAKVGAVTSGGITMSTGRLLGRTTASTGAVEEISVGANLTLSGGTLSSPNTANNAIFNDQHFQGL